MTSHALKVEEEAGGETTDEVASSHGRQHQRCLRLSQPVVPSRGRRQHVYRHVGHDGETLRGGEQSEPQVFPHVHVHYSTDGVCNVAQPRCPRSTRASVVIRRLSVQQCTFRRLLRTRTRIPMRDTWVTVPSVTFRQFRRRFQTRRRLPITRRYIIC